MSTLDLPSLRKDKGLTQKQLAAILNVQQSFISQVEHRKDPMPEHWAKIIVEKLGLSNIDAYYIDDYRNDPTARIDKLSEVFKLQIDAYRAIIAEKDQQIDKLLSIIKTNVQPL